MILGIKKTNLTGSKFARRNKSAVISEINWFCKTGRIFYWNSLFSFLYYLSTKLPMLHNDDKQSFKSSTIASLNESTSWLFWTFLLLCLGFSSDKSKLIKFWITFLNTIKISSVNWQELMNQSLIRGTKVASLLNQITHRRMNFRHGKSGWIY